jgi:sulfonate transport system permease protein
MSAAPAQASLEAPDSEPGTRRFGRVAERLSGLTARASFVAWGLVLPFLILLVWKYATDQEWLAPQILPPPTVVWESLVDLWRSGDLWLHLSYTLKRVSWSVLLGGGTGLVLGILFGISRRFRAYVFPTFQVVSQFPVVGWVPLLIIFLGIEEALKIVAVSIAVVVPVAVNTYKGIENIPQSLLEVARVYRFSRAQVILRVVLPAALPSIFNGVRQGVMQAWLSVVFVELLASSEGLGYLMVWARQLLQLDLVIVSMLLIGATGVVLDGVLRFAESRLQTWRRQAF